MPKREPRDDESAYTLPVVLMIIGGLLAGIMLLILTNEDVDDGSTALAIAVMAFGGLLAFIGATATAVLLGTWPLRRR